MYRYVATATRVHRVVLNGGQAFRVPLCNLSDRALLRMVDEAPAGVHCPHCWVGWEPPSEAEAAEHAGCAAANPEPPPGARATPMLEATRRLALLALVVAASAGVLAGIVFSPDLAAADQATPVQADELGLLRGRIDALQLEVRALTVSVAGHEHQPGELVVVWPSPTLGPPAPVPTPTPAQLEPVATPTPTSAAPAPQLVPVPVPPRPPAPVVVVVPVAPGPGPTSSPAPTPVAPTPTPCFRPGGALGVRDRCSWPPDN